MQWINCTTITPFPLHNKCFLFKILFALYRNIKDTYIQVDIDRYIFCS